MSKIDKYINICLTIVCAIFALIGLCLAIAAWIAPSFYLEVKIAATVFGLGFLFGISTLLIYLIWSKK